MTDIASAAAAVSAGYAKTQTDYGAGKSPRFVTVFDKTAAGSSAQAHGPLRSVGTSDVSAAAADTQALAALNGMRNVRYGTGATANSDSQGKAHSIDAT